MIADGYPQVAEVECGAGHQAEQGEPARVLGGLRYRRGRDRYRFLWRTERSWRGSCRRLLIKLADGTIQRADFRFKQPHRRRDAEDEEDD